MIESIVEIFGIGLSVGIGVVGFLVPIGLLMLLVEKIWRVI